MRLKLTLVLASVCLFGACALEPKRGESPKAQVIAQPAPLSGTDQLLAYSAQVRKLEARSLASEREQARNAFRAEQSEFNRVKLAVLLVSTPASSTTANATSDDAELVALLQPLVRSSGGSNVDVLTDVTTAATRSLAMLLYVMAQDRKKLRDQWREAQTRVFALRRDDDTKDAEARALRARVEELERKLAALKSIDRSVNRRSEAQGTGPQRVEPIK